MAITGKFGTLLGPLTTAWSMPETCTIQVANGDSRNRGFRGQRCAVSAGTAHPEDDVNCWPPVTNLPEMPTPPFIGWGFYSPGLACPTGYTAACTAQYGGRAGWEMQFTLIPGETAIGCCPEGYKCTNINGNTCIAANTQLTIATASCSGTQLVGLGQATIPFITEITTTETATATTGRGAIAVQTTTQEVLMLAPMFQLNYQASDLAAAGTTAPPTASASVSGSSTSDPNAAASSTPAADQGGLSTGAIVGIGVGAALGGILLGVVAILLFLRNRKRQRQSTTWLETTPPEGAGESPIEYKYGYAAVSPGPAVPELAHPDPNPVIPVELHSWSGSHAFEMPAGHGGDRLSHNGHS